MSENEHEHENEDDELRDHLDQAVAELSDVLAKQTRRIVRDAIATLRTELAAEAAAERDAFMEAFTLHPGDKDV
jgi:hypothetical protein